MIKYFYLVLGMYLFALSGCSKNKPEVYIKNPSSIVVDSKSEKLTVGFGSAIITPDLGLSNPLKQSYDGKRIPKTFRYTMAGYGRGRYAEGVHDHLWARAVVFESNGAKVGIVYLDLIGMHNNHISEIQKYVCSKLPLDYLIIGCTHNHEGPDTLGLWGKMLKSGIRKEYIEFLKYRVYDATEAALANLEKCEVHAIQYSTKDLGIAIDIRKPEFIPNIATLFQFKGPDNKLTGQIFHWEVHPEALSKHNKLLTSDFPHFVRKYLEDEFGGMAIYWTGAVGGLIAPARQIKDGDRVLQDGTFEHAALMGRRLVDLAKEKMSTQEKVSLAPIRLVSERVWVKTTNWKLKLASRIGLVRRKMPKSGYIETEIVGLKLGDLSLQTIPGEIYPELVYGPILPPKNADFPNAELEVPVILDLMQAKYKLVLGLALDEVGYIIPLNGWDEKKPYLGPEKYDSYGEELSPGVNFAKNLHGIVERVQNVVNNVKQ